MKTPERRFRYIASSEMRARLAEVLNRAAVAGDRLVVTRASQPIAALVSMKDFRLLVKLEDLVYVEEARVALRQGDSGIEADDNHRRLDTPDGFFLLPHDPMYLIYRRAGDVVEVLAIGAG